MPAAPGCHDARRLPCPSGELARGGPQVIGVELLSEWLGLALRDVVPIQPRSMAARHQVCLGIGSFVPQPLAQLLVVFRVVLAKVYILDKIFNIRVQFFNHVQYVQRLAEQS